MSSWFAGRHPIVKLTRDKHVHWLTHWLFATFSKRCRRWEIWGDFRYFIVPTPIQNIHTTHTRNVAHTATCEKSKQQHTELKWNVWNNVDGCSWYRNNQVTHINCEWVMKVTAFHWYMRRTLCRINVCLCVCCVWAECHKIHSSRRAYIFSVTKLVILGALYYYHLNGMIVGEYSLSLACDMH